MIDSSADITNSLDGRRVLILTGPYAGEEGICLGRIDRSDRWAVSPDCSNAILELPFGSGFALLLDLSASPSAN